MDIVPLPGPFRPSNGPGAGDRLSVLEQHTPWLSDPQPTQLPKQVDQAARTKGLWIDPVQFLALIHALALAQWACAAARAWDRSPSPRRACDRLRAPRTVIERCFAFLKRYHGLKYFQVQGLPAVWCHALLVHAAMLAVALIAYRAGHPDLMTSRAQVLAFVTN